MGPKLGQVGAKARSSKTPNRAKISKVDLITDPGTLLEGSNPENHDSFHRCSLSPFAYRTPSGIIFNTFLRLFDPKCVPKWCLGGLHDLALAQPDLTSSLPDLVSGPTWPNFWLT